MSLPRAACLAAAALVVSARQEPVAGLRRLAAEDRDLHRLLRVAEAIAGGAALPAALAAAGLLRRGEAAALAAAGPEALADGLARLAQAGAEPVPGERLARWLPLWAMLVATLPSLVIGAGVALASGVLYGGPLRTFGLWEPAPLLPGWLWLLQAGATLAAVASAWAIISGLRRTALWPATLVSVALERAVLLDDLVHAVRAGADADRLFLRWALLTGVGDEVRQARERCGGDLAATLVEVGVVPRDAERRADWPAACAATRHGRRLAAVALAPWLGAVLVIAGLAGFLTWGLAPWMPFYDLLQLQAVL